MARSEDVNILIKAKNEASGQFKQAKADVGDLAQSAAKANVSIARVGETTTGLRQASAGIGALSTKLQEATKEAEKYNRTLSEPVRATNQGGAEAISLGVKSLRAELANLNKDAAKLSSSGAFDFGAGAAANTARLNQAIGKVRADLTTLSAASKAAAKAGVLGDAGAPTQELAQIGTAVQRLRKELDSAGKQAVDTSKKMSSIGKSAPAVQLPDLKGQLQGMDKTLAGFLTGGGLGIVGGALGVGASIAAIGQIGSAIFDLSRQAAGVAALRQSFEGLAQGAGQSADAMLNAMRSASQGMISDQELILSANKAMMLGVADSAEEMAQLLEVAAVRGKAMGLSTGQAFSDLVTGIGRMSPLILDNLGIVTGGEAVFDAYAASLGRTAASLSDVEKKQALLNKVIAETDTSAMPVANQFERMDAAIQNAKIALGELFGPAVAAIAQQLADAATEVSDRLSTDGVNATRSAWADVSIELTNARDRLYELQSMQGQLKGVEPGFLPPHLQTIDPVDLTAQIAAQEQLIATMAKQVEASRQAYFAAQGLVEITAKTRDQAWNAATGWNTYAVSTDSASASAARHAAMAQQVRAQLAALAGQADVTGAALKSAWLAAAGTLGAAQALAGFQNSQKQLGALTQEWQYMGLTAEEIEFRKAELVQDTSGSINEQQRAVEELIKAQTASTAATGGQAAAVSALNQEYSNLLGQVQGLLSSQLDAGVGVKAEDLLPREDAINENARRLADIAVNGLKGQEWLDEFKAEAPGAWADIMLQVAAGARPQDAAAQMLRDFEDGMRTDLLDREAIKDRVRRMILGEQNMAALATEIAQELATEMNIPLSQAMAAAGASLGVPGSGAGEGGGADLTAAGGGAATSFVAGFTAGADGTTIVAGIVTKLEASFPRLFAAGASGGVQWGAGFMSTVEGGMAVPLINLLVTLVTPGVMAAVNGGTSATGVVDALRARGGG